MKKGALLTLLILTSRFCFSQTELSSFVKDSTDVEPRTQESAPHPRNRDLSVQARFDRQNFISGRYRDTYTIRTSSTFFGSCNFRVDLPYAQSNRYGTDESGLGDIRLRVMQSNSLNKNLYFGYGGELRFPSASKQSLGNGKWQARPEFGITYYLGKTSGGKSSIRLAANYRFDYAGRSDRNHISIVGFIPNIDFNGKKWYVGYYATWTYDFVRKAWDIPIDIEFGYKIVGQFTLSAEFIQPTTNNKVYISRSFIKLKYKFK